MAGAAIDQIDVHAYFDMLESAVPNIRALAIVDNESVSQHSQHRGARKTASNVLRQLALADPKWLQNTAAHGNAIELPGVCGMSFYLDGINALLIVTAEADSSHRDRAEPIVRCLHKELTLLAELDSMTEELTERYEELNLVYHTEDQVDYFREGREALAHLVDNCNNYLGVDMTALILRGKKIEMVSESPNHSPDSFVLERLRTVLYDWVADENATIVINDVADDLALKLMRGIPHKVLCTPVHESNGRVAGILAIVNDHSKPPFTNSDKNLLSVMARKAGKIIQANYDTLTGLVNRSGFEYFLDAAIEQVRGTSKQHCVLHINVDQLRVVNDTAGHHAGDHILRAIVNTISAHLRETDTMARIGGDQFGVLLENCTDKHARKIAEQIRKSVDAAEVDFNGRAHRVSISIGIATLGADTQELATVLVGAELACGESREKGGNRVTIYHNENSELVRRRKQMHLIEKIQHAISDDRFLLYSQIIEPIQDIREPRHFEVLLRMLDDGEVVPPGVFIPAAERYHLMPAIDRWVVANTLDTLADAPDDALGNSVFAINLSGQSIGDQPFMEFLLDLLTHTPVPKQAVCFEITETAAIQNLDVARHFITTLSAEGCQFSLDDFGAGLSSFSYLKSLPVDHLKIDGAFVKDLLEDQVSAAMVAAINQIGHTMGLKTIAEFVENDAVRERLVEIGVNYAQGFGIGRPIPLNEQLLDFVRTSNAAAS